MASNKVVFDYLGRDVIEFLVEEVFEFRDYPRVIALPTNNDIRAIDEVLRS
jgi:hypothetical protein